MAAMKDDSDLSRNPEVPGPKVLFVDSKTNVIVTATSVEAAEVFEEEEEEEENEHDCMTKAALREKYPDAEYKHYIDLHPSAVDIRPLEALPPPPRGGKWVRPLTMSSWLCERAMGNVLWSCRNAKSCKTNFLGTFAPWTNSDTECEECGEKVFIKALVITEDGSVRFKAPPLPPRDKKFTRK